MLNDKVTPPFSLTLVLSMLLRPLPIHILLQVFADLVVYKLTHNHPLLFGRLEEFSGSKLLIDISDLPYAAIFHIDEKYPKISITSNDITEPVIATVRCSFTGFLELLQGNSDGDALFFSRALIIEGNTEAILALRNAFDGENINLRQEFFGDTSYMAQILQKIAKRFESLLVQATIDLETLRLACIAPLQKRFDNLTGMVHRLEERLIMVEKQTKRVQDRLKRQKITEGILNV